MKPFHSIPALLLLVASPALAGASAAAPQEVVLAQGQTLAQIAEQHLGSADAADELRALNGLASGTEPAAGARLKLPGRDRARLVERLAGMQGGDAELLKRARELLARARYAEALALLPEESTSKFTVEVEPSGDTTVTVKQGPGLEIEAAGAHRRIEKGHLVQIRKGEAAPAPQRILEPPALAEPIADARIEAPAAGELLGPISFRWSPVEGAERYQVVISADAEGEKVVARVEATGAAAQLTSGLKAGSYHWRVIASGGGREVTSLVHGFRLVPAPPRLEVQKPRWK